MSNYSTYCRTREIKRRVKSLRNQDSESYSTKEESLAREFITRTLVLPELKRIFGDSLGSVLLVGSSQLGVRQASSQRVKSDLDLVCIFSDRVPEENLNLPRRMRRKVKSDFHFKVSLQYYNPEHYSPLKDFIINRENPFQVLYGLSFAKDFFGQGYFDKLPTLRSKYVIKKELRYTFKQINP